MTKQQYITPKVQMSMMIHPASMLCVSMQYDPNGGDPIGAV